MDGDQVLPLLDGLDEVAQAHREACVETINTFRNEHGLLPLVVCSRSADYAALRKKVRLHTAITIQPLTREQIGQYLRSLKREMVGVITTLQRDPTLLELLETPLLLSIVTLAYRGSSAEDLARVDPAERRTHLFETYVQRMLERKPAMNDPRYPPEQTRQWLTYLATQMDQYNQTVFQIEQLQPGWVDDQFLHNQICRQSCGTLYGIAGFVLGGHLLAFGGWISGQLLSILSAREIKPVEQLYISFFIINRLLFWYVVIAFTIGLVVAYIAGVATGISFFLSILVICIIGLRGVLSHGLVAKDIQLKATTNQGILSSIKNAFLVFLVITAISLIFSGFLLGDIGAGLTIGISFGIIQGSRKGGFAFIQHYALRLALTLSGKLPWNLARFLDHCHDLILLRKVGGGYIFIHRMLLEYFAGLDEQATTSDQRANAIRSDIE